METDWTDSTIIEETFDIVIAYDRQGKILLANRTAREKLEYTDEELKECNISSIFRQEFQREDGSYAPFDKEKLLEKEETALYRKNSSCFPATLRFTYMTDGTECILAQDISFQKNMDVRIRQIKEEGEENQRIRNEFVANVTHELRTPVNGIKGHVSALLDEIQDENQRKTLNIILYCCDNMSSIINNVLDFSKMEAGKFDIENAEFDFYKMMDGVIATHMPNINKKELHISMYIDKNIPQLLIGDELRISQILNNLLSNAVKFTTVGQISVNVSKTMQVNDEVELFFMVRDTGIGIAKDDQDKLFQSFHQVDGSNTRHFGGTGLGLSITKQLVEMMDGSIHLESDKGKGSCFSFNIRLKTSRNTGEYKDLTALYSNWENLTVQTEQVDEENHFEFGTVENKDELKKKMEKLILSIELGSWEKAEILAKTVKALSTTPDGFMKRPILTLEMAIRKEDYEKSIAAFEQVKEALAERLEE